MGWAPLPANVPLDAPQTATGAQSAPSASPGAETAPPTSTGGFSPLPPDAQLDQPAPDGSGFTDEQKSAILDYIPKAKDAADLERFSLEVSGGKSKIGNPQEVLDKLKSGAQPSSFAWTPPIIDKNMDKPQQPDNPLTLDHVRQAVGDALLNLIAPGSLAGEAAKGAGKAFTEHAANAVAFDYGPEVGGLIDTILHGGDASNNAAHERAQMMGDSADHPIASTAGELTGIGMNAGLGGAAADAANLGKVGRTVQMVTEGGAFGSGAAGPGNRATGAAAGAVLAPLGAAAVRGIAAVPGLLSQTAKTVLQGSPGLARRIIAKAINDDSNTPETVATDIASAHANEVPMALADTGENTRGLLAASARSSGVARTVARDALEERQSGLADRVTGAIQRDLGPVANPHELADTLMTKARDDAAPLYEQAYARPGADSFGKAVAPLLQRPSMKAALGNAYRIAQEEGRDPTTLGFGLDGEGNVTLERVPSWQTLDYVKRGLDDVVESYRDPTTGRLNLDTEGRAVNNTRATFLKAFDNANPVYGQARAAYGGPVSGISAMNLGRKALNMTADDLEARMRDMTPFEKQMFALGTRRAMAETVSSKGDTADVVNALVGTGKKRAMLARLFGDRPAFARFVDTLGQEREGWRTFKQSLLGSPTAANLADDGTLKAAIMTADFAGHGIPVGTAASKAIKFLGVKVGQKAQEEIAALLSNTDPAAIRELAAELRAQAQKRGINVPRLRLAAHSGGDSLSVAIPKAQHSQ